MKNEHNELVPQTDNQRSPGMASPRDFVVNAPDNNQEYPFGGQTGDSEKECNDLLSYSKEYTGGTKAAESRNEKELAQENLGKRTKQ